MKLWRVLLQGLLASAPASVDASSWDNNSSGWLFLTMAVVFIVPATLAFLVFIFRVNRKLKAIVAAGQRASLMQQNRSRILSMIVEQAPLLQVLDALVEGAQQMDPSASCTVLLLDDQGFLHVASAPDLPEEYNAAIDGLAAGYAWALVVPQPIWVSG